MSKIFNDAFADLTINADILPFNPLWSNGTGYFDNAVDGRHAPALAEGRVVTSVQTTENGTGRRLIMIGTCYGNVVLFDRYNGEGSVIVYNVPQALEQLFMGSMCSGAQSEDQLLTLLGNKFYDNVGERLRNAAKFHAWRQTKLAEVI